jgi:hypothetical protein
MQRLNQLKHIAISEKNYDMLKKIGAYGDTMDDIVSKVLTYAPKKEGNR